MTTPKNPPNDELSRLLTIDYSKKLNIRDWCLSEDLHEVSTGSLPTGAVQIAPARILLEAMVEQERFGWEANCFAAKKDERYLDAYVFQVLYRHPELIPEAWKRIAGGIFFFGTVFAYFEDYDNGRKTRAVYCIVGFRWYDYSSGEGGHWCPKICHYSDVSDYRYNDHLFKRRVATTHPVREPGGGW